MTKTKHVHRYKRFVWPNGSRAYRCILPGCTHFIAEHLILGREALCPRCGSIFVVNEKQSKLAKPHCGCKNRLQQDSALVELTKDLVS